MFNDFDDIPLTDPDPDSGSDVGQRSEEKVRAMAGDEAEMPTLHELLDKYGKRCPRCGSGQVSSDNSTPLNHKCLDCKLVFTDAEAVVGGKQDG